MSSSIAQPPGYVQPFRPLAGTAPGAVQPMAPVGVGGPGDAPARSHKEMMVNATCSYPFMARAWREGYEKRMAPFDACFIDACANDVIREQRAGHQTVRVMNLPLLNTWLSRYKDSDDAMNRAKGLTFAGTLRNDEQLSGGAPGAQGERGSAYRRLLNVDVRGASRIRNYWPDAVQGDHLVFVVVATNGNTEISGTQYPEDTPSVRYTSDQTSQGETVRHARATLVMMRALNYPVQALNAQQRIVQTAQRAQDDAPAYRYLQVRPALAHLVHSVVHHDENIVRILDVGIANEHIHRGATASVGAVTAATTTFDANDALPVIRYVCDARLSAL